MNNNYKLLRLFRRVNKISLKELSNQIGIAHQRLSDIENGLCFPKEETIKSIEKALNISFEDNEYDIKMLNFKDEFIDSLYYGYDSIDDIKNKVVELSKIGQHTKYRYHLPVYEYILSTLSKYDFIYDGTDKYLSDDEDIYYLYLIYKSKESRVSNYGESLRILDDVINNCNNKKISTLAMYHKCILFIANYKMLDALLIVDTVKNRFENDCAYIRSYNCNQLKSESFHYLKEHQKSIEIDLLCIRSIKNLGLSNRHKGKAYRNLAYSYFLTKQYKLAIDTLDIAAKFDENNNLLIMYYIYNYACMLDFDNALTWIEKAETSFYDKGMTLELDFWKAVVKNRKNKPTNNIINKSVKILDYYEKNKYYEAYFFQLDITVILYEIIEDYHNAYNLCKKKNDLLNKLKNA